MGSNEAVPPPEAPRNVGTGSGWQADPATPQWEAADPTPTGARSPDSRAWEPAEPDPSPTPPPAPPATPWWAGLWLPLAYVVLFVVVDAITHRDAVFLLIATPLVVSAIIAVKWLLSTPGGRRFTQQTPPLFLAPMFALPPLLYLAIRGAGEPWVRILLVSLSMMILLTTIGAGPYLDRSMGAYYARRNQRLPKLVRLALAPILAVAISLALGGIGAAADATTFMTIVAALMAAVVAFLLLREAAAAPRRPSPNWQPAAMILILAPIALLLVPQGAPTVAAQYLGCSAEADSTLSGAMEYCRNLERILDIVDWGRKSCLTSAEKSQIDGLWDRNAAIASRWEYGGGLVQFSQIAKDAYRKVPDCAGVWAAGPMGGSLATAASMSAGMSVAAAGSFSVASASVAAPLVASPTNAWSPVSQGSSGQPQPTYAPRLGRGPPSPGSLGAHPSPDYPQPQYAPRLGRQDPGRWMERPAIDVPGQPQPQYAPHIGKHVPGTQGTPTPTPRASHGWVAEQPAEGPRLSGSTEPSPIRYETPQPETAPQAIGMTTPKDLPPPIQYQPPTPELPPQAPGMVVPKDLPPPIQYQPPTPEVAPQAIDMTTPPDLPPPIQYQPPTPEVGPQAIGMDPPPDLPPPIRYEPPGPETGPRAIGMDDSQRLPFIGEENRGEPTPSPGPMQGPPPLPNPGDFGGVVYPGKVRLFWQPPSMDANWYRVEGYDLFERMYHGRSNVPNSIHIGRLPPMYGQYDVYFRQTFHHNTAGDVSGFFIRPYVRILQGPDAGKVIHLNAAEWNLH